MQLRTYTDFIDRADELGFMAFSNILPGFPSLAAETSGGAWHTGDPETDPWCWKDRAAEEKKLAFGCILGGHKGFVSARMYQAFLAACHPDESIEERRAYGLVSEATWRLWQLFQDKPVLDTGDVRREMGVSKKKGGSRVEAAMKELQQQFYITVAGNRRKLDKFGQPYGWPANIYEVVTNWVPEEWLNGAASLTKKEARELILDTGAAIGKDVDRRALSKILFP